MDSIMRTCLLSIILVWSGGFELNANETLYYPCWRGAYGNGTADDSGNELIDNLLEAKLVWESEEQNIPSSYNLIMGGASGPVVAGGRVFLNYCQPSGDIVAEEFYQRLMENFERNANKKKLTREDVRRRCLCDGDDVVLCMDLQTGKTIWKTVFNGKGMNPSMQVRGWPSNKRGPHSYPAIAYGKVAVLGSTGNIYALNEKTGELLWETQLPMANSIHQKKLEAIQNKSIAASQLPDLCGSVTIADGIFVVPSSSSSIMGLNPENGHRLWETKVPNGNFLGRSSSSPTRWVHNGKEYILAGTACVVPKTGEILWSVDAAHGITSVSCDENHAVYSGSRDAGMSCYSISENGAQKLWQLEPKYYASSSGTPAIYKGSVYIKFENENQALCNIACICLKTGKVKLSVPFRSDAKGSLIAGDGRVIYEKFLFNADPDNFKALGQPFYPGDHVPFFADSHSPCLVGGFWFVRGQNSVRCFDLRKSTAGSSIKNK